MEINNQQNLKDISQGNFGVGNFNEGNPIGHSMRHANTTPTEVPDKIGLFKRLFEVLQNKTVYTAAANNYNKGQVKDKNFKGDVFDKGLLYVENRGNMDKGDEIYKTVGEQTGDLGKYQVKPATLKDWSKSWLGKEYTPEEFLNDPEAQEEFKNQFKSVAERLDLTPEEAAITWHRGFGILGSGEGTREERDKKFRKYLENVMKEDESQEYLNSFREGVNKK